MHLESHQDGSDPDISGLQFEGEEGFHGTNEELQTEWDKGLDRTLDVFLTQGEDLILLDRRENKTSRGDRKEREIDIMSKTDVLFERIQNSGIDTNFRIDEELRATAKRLILLVDRQRTRLNFPTISVATLIQLVYEIWYTDHLHGHRKRHSGKRYSRDHLMGALENLIVYTGLTGVSTIIATLRHDDYEDLPPHQKNKQPDLLFALSHYKNDLEMLLTTEIAQSRLDRLRARVHGLVDAVTNLKAETGIDKQITDAKSFWLFLQSMAMGAGPRVAYVRLAERLHNVCTIDAVPDADKRQAKLVETANIHVPMAGVLHLEAIRRALLESCFKFLNPSALNGFNAIQEQRLYEHLGPEGGRLKSQLCTDLKSLSNDPHVHFIGLVPSHFADYADPHELNNTSYIPPVDDWDPMFELYIQTEQPEDVREIVLKVMNLLKSPASKYPEPTTMGDKGTRIDLMSEAYNGRVQIRINDQQSEARRIRGFLPSGEEETNPIIRAGIERVLAVTKDKVEAVFNVAADVLLKPTIRVLTPKSNEITLLSGSNALDFAAAIHTDMPARVVRVVRRRKPKDPGEEIHVLTPLEDDDIIEIIVDNDARPDLGWYCFVQGQAHKSLKRSYQTLDDKERVKETSKYLGRLTRLLGIHEQHSVLHALTLLNLPEHLRPGLERHEELGKTRDAHIEELENEPVDAAELKVKIGKSERNLAALESQLLEAQKSGIMKRICLGRLNPLEFFAENVDFSAGLEIEISMPNKPDMARIAADFFARADINLSVGAQEPDEDPKRALLILKIKPFSETTTPYDVLKVLLRINYEYPVRVRSPEFKDFVAKSLPEWALDISSS